MAVFLSPALASASPLTIYDQPNLGGTGTAVTGTYTIYSDSEIPGGLNNKISSFQLDQGYSLIVADQADGLNPSKVYVASEAPITVNSLPAELDNAVSFIRIVPWQNATKKGHAGKYDNDPSVDTGWYYAWAAIVESGQEVNPFRGQYVPQAWGKGGSDDSKMPDYWAMDQVTHLLSFNEPDDCNGQSGQYGDMCTISTAVAYHTNLQKAGLRLGSPAGREQAANNDSSWTSQFIFECDAAGIRVDFTVLHWYDWGGWGSNADPNDNPTNICNRFKKYLSKAYHRHKRPLWITEFNANKNRVTSVQDGFLQLALPYLEGLGYVERYSYFQPNGGYGDFYAAGNKLTSTGQIYKDQVSSVAYTQNILPAGLTSVDVGSPSEAGEVIHANGNFTVCGNGAGTGGTTDEFHFVYETVSGDCEIVAKVSSMVPWGADTQAGVMIRESLATGSAQASMLVTQGNGAAFESRTTTGGTLGSTTVGGIAAPYWVKLVRTGNLLTGYTSPDGVSWTAAGSQTVSMNTDVLVGLMSATPSSTQFNDAVFTDVSVVSIEVVDSDFDELPDAWERQHFGDLATSSGGNDNQDGDPSSDLLEFLAGTNPTNGTSFFQIWLAEADPGTYEVNFDATSNRTYVLQTSTTVSNGWSVSASVSPPTNGLQSLPLTDPGNPPSLFGRIGISLP